MACAPGTCGCGHDLDGHRHGGHDRAGEQPTGGGASCCGDLAVPAGTSDPQPADKT